MKQIITGTVKKCWRSVSKSNQDSHIRHCAKKLLKILFDIKLNHHIIWNIYIICSIITLKCSLKDIADCPAACNFYDTFGTQIFMSNFWGKYNLVFLANQKFPAYKWNGFLRGCFFLICSLPIGWLGLWNLSSNFYWLFISSTFWNNQ